MLTKGDLKHIEDIVQKNIKAGFRDFFESIFEPYVNRNEDEHEEIRKEMRGMKREVTEIKEFIKDHEHRIEKVEAVSAIKN